jgi:hypothetical protein
MIRKLVNEAKKWTQEIDTKSPSFIIFGGGLFLVRFEVAKALSYQRVLGHCQGGDKLANGQQPAVVGHKVVKFFSELIEVTGPLRGWLEVESVGYHFSGVKKLPIQKVADSFFERSKSCRFKKLPIHFSGITDKFPIML